mmetsp:Transcript_23936/g.78028  ORF Transcript_23936/g.78028 Transcript_23936/m.78028 type:complete len:221 (-) Transcript_23936:381-1043(-)
MLRRPLCALGRPSALALLPRACRVAPRALAIHPRAAAVAPCRQLHSSLRAKEEATAPAAEAATEEALDYSYEGVLFEGGKNLMVKRLKLASVLNLGFALASAPVLQVLTSADGNGAKGVAMSATLVLFGGSTTGMLAWVSGTYVLGMRALPGKKVAIDTPTLLGGVHTTECDWSEIGRPGSYHPFSTFGAKGAVFWLDEDGTLVDPQVLQKIEAALNRDY